MVRMPSFFVWKASESSAVIVTVIYSMLFNLKLFFITKFSTICFNISGISFIVFSQKGKNSICENDLIISLLLNKIKAALVLAPPISKPRTRGVLTTSIAFF